MAINDVLKQLKLFSSKVNTNGFDLMGVTWHRARTWTSIA